MSIKTWPNLFSRNPRTRQIFGPQIPTPIVFLVIFALIIGSVYLITAGLDKLDGRDESDEIVCPELVDCSEMVVCPDSTPAPAPSPSDAAYATLQEENTRLQEALKESEAEQEKLVGQLQGCETDKDAGGDTTGTDADAETP